MFIRIIIGYLISVGLTVTAVIIDTPLAVFFDIPTVILLYGGTSFLLFTQFKGLSINKLTWLGTPATTFITVTGIIVVMIGLVKLLTVLPELKDPATFGPSMALNILGILYTLTFMAFVSIPLEDWHNQKRGVYDEVSLSRVSWFLFPIASTFFVLIPLAVLFHAMYLTIN